MDAAYKDLLSRVTATYHRALIENPAARAWLAGRGIESPALLERFQIGWATGTLAQLARGEVLDRLKALGLVDAEGRDRFADRLVLPAFDDGGAVAQLAFYDQAAGLSWLFPDETPVLWNGACLGHSREVALAPDPLAALAVIAGGQQEVIAPAGPGIPLGRNARDPLVAHAPCVTILRGAERLRPELDVLGIPIAGRKAGLRDRVVEREADGFMVELPRRLRLAVRGISQDSPRHLRASVRAFRSPAGGETESRPRLHVDTFDLYQARSRAAFAKTAACLLGEDPAALEEALGSIVKLAEEFLENRVAEVPRVVLSEPEKEEALEFLRDPKLLDRVLGDLSTLGYVGEEENKLAAYVASLSRKLDDPLSILVVSRSSAGKSTLAEAIASLAPLEDVQRYTRLTAQTLYYQKPDALCHKLVLVEEAEGVEDAAYALRILQSARKLSLSTAAGHGDAKTREVKGPVSLFVTTTRTDLNEETAGRFVTLAVDESKEQTRAILAAQRQAEARGPGGRELLLALHRNAQRLLLPCKVVNPYGPHLTFPDDRLTARRDHAKYLALIRAVAFVHQHQRKREGDVVVVALEDVAIANRLAHHALGQSLYDLAPPSRRLLMELREWIEERATREGLDIPAVRFSQRELREKTGWKRTQLAEHVKELVEAEYLVTHVSPPGRRTRYAIDWDGKGLDGERFYRGLTDTTELSNRATSGPRPDHDRADTGSAGRPRKRPGKPSTPKIPLHDRTSGERKP